MANDNSGGNSGGWFPNLNNLLLILLAGTLLVGQHAYHESRPSKPDAKPAIADVDARLWQDPFEAVKQHIEKNLESDKGDGTGRLQKLHADIEAKLKLVNEGEHCKPEHECGKLNVLAVMLPGAPYYEDGEIRRRLRYAALSGFNAALRYTPENPNYINFFKIAKNDKTLPEQHVAYEWMTYKPEESLPPVLILWLDNDKFRGKPHELLVDLLNRIQTANDPQKPITFKVNAKVLGPYDSDNLQDMVREFGTNKASDHKNLPLSFYSPSASVQDSSLLKGVPELKESFDENYSLALTHPENFVGPKYNNLQHYFKAKSGSHLNFVRVNSSDQYLAVAIKQELFKRGIELGENSRVLLLSEWDTLYGLHLPDTFAAELIKPFPEKGPEDYPSSNTCIKHKDKDENKKAMFDDWNNLQDGSQIYDEKFQCVFRFSYLRGLDGEKAKSGDKPTPSSSKSEYKGNSVKSGGVENLEDAEGNSQFDYVRRMANQIAELDQRIRNENKLTAHAIQAIGILGSDVYDKLLILEAMHDKFPDAIYFTNGLDARFLHPEDYKWARNLLLASTFDLTLDRPLQRDIPPFRDSTQTAYFLATEMALASMAKTNPVMYGHLLFGQYSKDNKYCEVNDNKDCKEYKEFISQAFGSQEEFDKLLMYPRIKEVGKTRFSDISFNPPVSSSENAFPSIHPNLSDKQENGHETHILKFFIIFPLAIIIIPLSLYHFRVSREYLSNYDGLSFIFLMGCICIFVPIIVKLLIFTSSFITQEYVLLILLFILGLIYLIIIGKFAINPLVFHSKIITFVSLIIISTSKRWPNSVEIVHRIKTEIASNDENKKNQSFVVFIFSIILIIVLVAWLFWVARPTGWLDGGEQYYLSEGISMWPTEGIRLIALVVTSYLIIDVYRFKGISEWLDTHKIKKSDYNGCKPLKLWDDWWNTKRRMFRPMVMAIIFFGIGLFLVYTFGMPNIPGRGILIHALDDVLMRGLLVPAYALLLFLVVDTVNNAINLVDKSFPHEDKPDERTEWPREIRRFYAQKLAIGENELHEWVSMRFVNELTEGIYRIIGYPLIVSVMIVVARSTYFDNWHMPIALKAIIGFSLGILIYCDYRLKGKADEARKSALKWLRQRVVYCNGLKSDSSRNKGPQLEKLIGMIENSENVVYQSFFQRPIFRNILLIVVALLADSADYTAIVSRLF